MFYKLKTKETEELAKAVAKELNEPDPDEEKAKALLNDATTDEDDTESS